MVVLYGLDAEVRERIAALREHDRFFWLDASLSDTDLPALAEALAISERAIQALRASDGASASRTVHADVESVAFALRCHVESEMPDGTAARRLRSLEVRVLITGGYLLTVHEERISLPAVLGAGVLDERGKGYLVYSALDAMLASSFDALGEVERSLDALAEALTSGGGGREPRTTLRDSGVRLAAMRRWATAQQGVLNRLGVEIRALRGFGTSDEPYFDRLDAQNDRLLASIDAAANATGTLLDLQLNERAYVVSVVATIFVPLTFVTGFFGMNFGWMIDRVDSQGAFWLLAIVIPIVTGLLAWRLVVQRFLVGDYRTRRPR
jgi:magnesium transporter